MGDMANHPVPHDPAVKEALDTRRARLLGTAPGQVIFETVYGSWAHGTNLPSSDIDWRGVYLLPDDEFLGLGRPKTTWEDRDDDRVFWEVGHFCNLLLKGNPNIVGMLFAPSDCLVKMTAMFAGLPTLRRDLLSQSLRSAYRGWIHREAEDVAKLHKGNAKRLSHLPRLIWELEGALTNRWIDVRPSEERRAYIKGIKTGAVDYDEAMADVGNMILDLDALDAKEGPALPEAPRAEVHQWLLETRRMFGGRS